MRYFFLFLLFLIAKSTPGQSIIKGKILDANTKKGVGFATVYINGTTRGVVTEESGAFELKVLNFPTEIIVSHLGYERKVVSLTKPLQGNLVVLTLPTVQELKAVRVEDKNLRKKNLAEFKTDFLGLDNWGKQASILNDEVISFSRDYETRRVKSRIVVRNGKKDTLPANTKGYKLIERPVNLKAKSRQPIIVKQEDLGYKVQVDLVSFMTEYAYEMGNNNRNYLLGYYFFEPDTTTNKRLQKRYQKNRERAYYNSSLHFLRALYYKQLGQNGYEFKERVRDPETKQVNFIDFDIYPHLKYNPENSSLHVVGLKDKVLTIIYYPDNKGRPKDITKKKRRVAVQSLILFLEDQCLVRSNGTISDPSIVFGGTIGEKKVGAMLPDDFSIDN